MRVFEYLTKAPDNQMIDRILESSNTQKNLIYNEMNMVNVLILHQRQSHGKGRAHARFRFFY